MTDIDPELFVLECDNCLAPAGQACQDGCPGYVEDEATDANLYPDAATLAAMATLFDTEEAP